MLEQKVLIRSLICFSFILAAAGVSLAEEVKSEESVSMVPEGVECLMLIGSIDCDSKSNGRGVSSGVYGVCKSTIAFRAKGGSSEVMQVKTRELTKTSSNNRDDASPLGFLIRLGSWVVTGGMSEYWGKHISANAERSRAARYMTYLVGVKLREDMRIAGVSQCTPEFKDNSSIVIETSSVEAH